MEVFLVNFQICYLALVVVVDDDVVVVLVVIVVFVVVIVVFVVVIVIFIFVQTLSRNPADTTQIPFRNLQKTI